MMTQQTFCQFPWTSLMIDLERDLWRWCPNVPVRQGFADYYPMSKDLDSVRAKFSSGEKPPQCNACWQKELLGFDSFRTVNKGNAYDPLTGLRFLDVKLSSTCDINCATCGPSASSRWREKYIKDNTAPYRPKNLFSPADTSASFDKLCGIITNNMNTLERISINGGEPTVDPKFFQLLAHLSTLPVQVEKPLLRFVTNANLLTSHLITMLNDLSSQGWRLNVVVSMDAAGPEQDFIRAGSNWIKVESNTKQLIEFGYCREFNIVFSPFNISVLGSIPAWLDSNGWLDVVKPRLIMPQHPFDISMLGGMAIYLMSPWNEKYQVHQLWKDFIDAVNKSARKQRFVFPDLVRLDRFIEYVNWYSNSNRVSIPVEMKKMFYLVDLVRRQPKLFGLENLTVVGKDQDPE